ncbi:MAG: flagellin [Candidatus Zixiibacteriota bacterium]
MGMQINNNLAALDAHRNLLSTTRQMSLAMEKLSSGYRINRASDDPAGLVISEQFRAQIAGLNRAIQNSEGSINMIQTAEGALTEINNLLVKMRELAIHAANEGFNDAAQLDADQAEIANSIATIDRIAKNTQFGTKKLLDGSKENSAIITSTNTSLLTVKQSRLTTGAHSLIATKTADATASLNSTSLGFALKTGGTVYNLEEKIHNLDVIQASAGATRSSTTISITDAFSNSLVLGTAAQYATMTTLGTVGLAMASEVGNYSVVVNYQEAGSNPVGDQTLTISVALNDSATQVVAKLNAAIAANASLAGKLEAASAGAAAGTVTIRSVNKGAQYSLKLTSFSYTSAQKALDFGTTRARRGVSLDRFKLQATTANQNGYTTVLDLVTAAAGTKTFTSVAALVTEFNRALKIGLGSVATGSVNNVVAAADGTDKVKLTTSDEGSDYKLKILSNGTAAEDAENVLGFAAADTIDRAGTDALMSFDGFTTSITKVKYAATWDVTIGNKAEGAAGRGTIDLTINTAANGLNVGTLLLDVKAAKFDVRLDGGPATSVTAGKDTLVYNADRSESIKVNYALISGGGTEQLSVTDQSLVFQIGASVGQITSISLPNMSTSALGKNLAGNMWADLSKIDVTTVQGAQDAQSVVDAAINEVSGTRGNLGTFQKNTLESNLSNLRIAAQNLTAAESSIRDTDMASEMSQFVKYQILLQAGTAMLAQANQVPQVVLSLFQ